MAFNISYVYHAIDKFTPTVARINKSVDRTRKKLRRLGNQMDVTRRKTDRFGNALNSAKSKIAALGAMLLGAVGVKALLSFDKEMSNVKAKSGATADEFKLLRDEAKRLGATSIFSASEIAGGMTFLAKAGFNTEKILASIVDVQNLAASSGIDMASAGNIVSNVMSGMGIKAKDLAGAVDTLAAATAGSNIDIMSVGQGMKFAGGTAASLDQSLNQVVATLGALGDAGLEGGMAGRNLRIILLKLANLPPKVSSGLQQMGVDLKKINPVTSDLTTIFDEFAKAGLSVAQTQALVGVEAFTAFTILTKESKKVKAITKALDGSAGAAKRMADIMKDNLAGGVTELVSAFEGLIITMGDLGLTQVLRNIAFALTSLIRIVQSFMEKFPRLTTFISTLISTLITFKLVMMAWAAVTKLATIAAIAFNVALLLNPIGLIVLGVAAAIALFVAFRKEIGSVITSFLGLFSIEMPTWLKGLLGLEGVEIKLPSNQLNKKSSTGGVAVDAASAASTLNGIININAPTGVVNNTSMSVKGAGGNLGMSMAGAL
jgi:TP901 family phage tail tape measure protein